MDYDIDKEIIGFCSDKKISSISEFHKINILDKENLSKLLKKIEKVIKKYFLIMDLH